MWQKCHIFFYVAYIPKHNVLNLLLRSAADEINEYVMPVHTSKVFANHFISNKKNPKYASKIMFIFLIFNSFYERQMRSDN